MSKYSANTPSSPDPACSHMTQYNSGACEVVSYQAGLGEPGALAKHLQGIAYAANIALTRMVTLLRSKI